MKRNKRRIYYSIYFRLIAMALLLIVGINLIVAVYLKDRELKEAEKQVELQLIEQSKKIITLKSETGSDFLKYVKYLDHNILQISVYAVSDFYKILKDESKHIIYDEAITYEDNENRLILLKYKEPMSFNAVLLIGDDTLLIKPNLDYSVIDQLTARIWRFIETAFIMSFLIFIILIVYISHKIKRVTLATKIVSNGTFDIELSEKGKDEIAELAMSFNYMVKELKKNEYLHKEFINSVSHEFKTPITSLKGYAVLAKSPEISDQQRQEYLDIIINESNRLSKLSSNLLRISELDNKRILKHHKWFSLDEQIRDIIILLQPQWEDNEIELDVDLEEVNIYGDQSVLWHLWNNLISNAVRYSRAGGIIKVNLRIHKSMVLFQVQDNGIGIPKEAIERIYEQFYTVDRSRRDGNGLGLAIVKKIVDLYDGRIRVESIENSGSCFYVEFDLLDNNQLVPVALKDGMNGENKTT